jgi:DNA-binding transcriptional MocR family regulator
MAYELSGSQLRVPKAAELVAARIRGQIIRAELKQGDALPAESELMETFGLSRPRTGPAGAAERPAARQGLSRITRTGRP